MACCVLVAFIITRLISKCETLHINLSIQYNESFEPGPLAPSTFNPTSKQVTQDANANEMRLTRLSLRGLTCSACASTITQALEHTVGVDAVRISLPLLRGSVYHDSHIITPERLKAIVEETGYGAEVSGRDVEDRKRVLARQHEEMASLKRGFERGVGLLICLLGTRWVDLGVGTVLHGILTSSSARWVGISSEALLSLAIQVFCASFIYRNALRAAAAARANMDTLVAVSNSLGMVLSLVSLLSGETTTYFATTAGLTIVVLGGRYLDALARRDSAKCLTSLYANHASAALVRREGRRSAVPAGVLEVGEEIVVPAYSVVPVDCYVLKGTSQVDESIITGESRPVSKTVGALLRSGSRNGNGEVVAVVYKVQEESTLSAMIETISDATETKPSIQSSVDRLMLWFVLGVFSLTLLRTLAGWLWIERNMPLSIRLDILGRRAMTMLLAACPCAIGLSVPSAIMAGIDAAWQRGIIITDGASVMERLRNVTCVVLDKTGTLTDGKLKVGGIEIPERWRDDWSTFCFLVCAAEEPGAAVHPAGQAVFEHFFAEVGESWLGFKGKSTVTGLQEVPGQGVSCTVASTDRGSHHVCLGNAEMMARDRIAVPDNTPGAAATSIVHVAIDNVYAGHIALADTARSDASATLSRLRSRNLKQFMLTGDTTAEAQRISVSLDLPLLAAKASPEDKLAHIRSLQEQGEVVLMVGDGLNDSTALAAADVGVMISTNRRCATLGGNVLILSPKLAALADLLEISEQSMRMVSSNLMWAVTYNVVAMTLAMGLGEPVGLSINPTVGAMLMSVSSISIAFRSISLRRRLMQKGEMEKG